MKLKSLKSVKNIKGKTILLRVAYDVPLKKSGQTVKVADDRRIRETVPTINYLLKNNCKIALLTWVGRPDGKVVSGLSTKPIAKALAKILKRPVGFVDDCVGPKVTKTISRLKPKQLLMLENVRFYPEEEADDQMFAALLVEGYDMIVFDAFAQSHRVHASTTSITKLLPAYSGLLLEKELKALDGIVKQPKRPLMVILGGAKLSDKVVVLEELLKKADKVLIGGGIANVFFKALKVEIGSSFVQSSFVDKAKRKNVDYVALAKKLYSQYRNKIVLPVDLISASKMAAGAKTRIIDLENGENISKNEMFLDIGPKTVELFKKEIKKAKTIFWNGPMGVFEIKEFTSGTKALASALVKSSAKTVIGGGDTETVVALYKLEGKFNHVSTGGGASLEYLSGKKLPALKNIQS